MNDELLHLTDHESMRIVSESPGEITVEATWQPGGGPPPPHFHPSQDEHFEITLGHLSAVVAGVRHDLGPGASLSIPRGTPHRMWNAWGTEASAVWRTIPAGRTGEWFRTIDRLGDSGRRKPALPALAAALTEYDDVFRLAVGPAVLRPAIQLALRGLALAKR